MKTCPICRATYPDNVGFCPDDGSGLRSAAGLEPGTIIRKKYEVLGEIARGGMGVVYRVRHLLWNEEKAIKLLLDVGAEGMQQSKGFLAEALVMRQFQHPNIVRVEDADFTQDDKLFVVMEYIEGESLRQRMDRSGPLQWEQALDLTAQACAGLAAAHAKGIVHRDIKPQNLLLTMGADGREVLKLIDFGIAKVREDAGLGFTGMIASQPGFFVGTPEYASPEQATGVPGSELDGRTDLYSLGLVLYEMLTGAKPFRADTPVASLLLRLQNDPVPPREVRPDLEIPETVSELVMKAAAREREARWGSAEETRQAMASILDHARVEQGRRERQERERAEAEREAARQQAESERVAPEAHGPAVETAVPAAGKKVGTGVIAGAAAAVGAAALGVLLLWPKPPATTPVKPASATAQPPVDSPPKPADTPAIGRGEDAGARPRLRPADMQPGTKKMTDAATSGRQRRNTPTAAIPSPFVIGGSADAQTVLDSRTGLMWARKDQWGIDGTFSVTWKQAMDWVKKMNTAAYAGFRDWSVPTIAQYGTIKGPRTGLRSLRLLRGLPRPKII